MQELLLGGNSGNDAEKNYECSIVKHLFHFTMEWSAPSCCGSKKYTQFFSKTNVQHPYHS